MSAPEANARQRCFNELTSAMAECRYPPSASQVFCHRRASDNYQHCLAQILPPSHPAYNAYSEGPNFHQ
jgi:hypothetical protein